MIRAQIGELSLHSTKYSSRTLTQKVFVNMRRVGKRFSRVDTPLFEGMIVAHQDDDITDEGAASVAIDDVPVAVDEPFIPSPTPTTQPPPPSQDLPFTSQDVAAVAKDVAVVDAEIEENADIDYFKGMSYDDIRPIFKKKFNSNVAFLEKTKEQMEEEEDSRALKRKVKSSEDKATKKQKLDEEVEELRKHLHIVPNDDDDVYTEATPLALKRRLKAKCSSLNLEESKKCSWFSKGQKLETIRILCCADYNIHHNIVDLVDREKISVNNVYSGSNAQQSRGWFECLLANKINEWSDLREAFATGYSVRRACFKEPHEITKIVRKDNESLTAFKEIWMIETGFVIGVLEVMKISSFIDSLKCPELAKRFSDKAPATVNEMMKRLDDFVQSKRAFAQKELFKGEIGEQHQKSYFSPVRKDDGPYRNNYTGDPWKLKLRDIWLEGYMWTGERQWKSCSSTASNTPVCNKSQTEGDSDGLGRFCQRSNKATRQDRIGSVLWKLESITGHTFHYPFNDEIPHSKENNHLSHPIGDHLRMQAVGKVKGGRRRREKGGDQDKGGQCNRGSTSKPDVSRSIGCHRRRTPRDMQSHPERGGEDYAPLEKLALSLVHMTRRLRRYFKAHLMKVIIDQPIKQILNKTKAMRKLAKYAIDLGAYNITFEPRNSVKRQVLVDFITETPNGETSELYFWKPEIVPERDDTEEWILFTNRAPSVKGSGASLVLIGPSGIEHTYALCLTFDSTNNEAEYKALLAGLRIAKKMNIQRVEAKVDYKLVASQINENCKASNDNMVKYLAKEKEYIAYF
nr:reverse transcriptase domain-containing protein [Tanacetum cinerariifolium]